MCSLVPVSAGARGPKDQQHSLLAAMVRKRQNQPRGRFSFSILQHQAHLLDHSHNDDSICIYMELFSGEVDRSVQGNPQQRLPKKTCEKVS